MTSQSISDRLAAVRGQDSTIQHIAQEAVALAEALLHAARAEQTSQEYQQAQKIARLMDDPQGKALTIALADQLFRSKNPARIASQLQHLLRTYGLPRYMQRWEQVALGLGGLLGPLLPGLVVPPITARLRQETRTVILPGEEQALRSYITRRRQTGIRLNLNQLGEAILGEEEARRRLDAYLELLARDDVTYISVKPSSIFSQINLVAFDHTIQLLKERLRELYRTAMRYTYRQPDGSDAPKFINLDMEEYRDLHLTVTTFCAVLDEPEFLSFSAGLVLQAYLPDSADLQRELTAWAMERCQRGGAPIKIRLVKGANLAMEQVEASLHGWPQSPYTSKRDVDANYKRMILYGCQPAHAACVHLGIASHNLFDIAFALIVRASYQVEACVDFEMLEGMANHQARAVQQAAGGLLFYAPVVKKEDFHSAIAYLVRRLDENTAPENFLHDLFGLESDSNAWTRQSHRFLESCHAIEQISDQPRRSQNRATEQSEQRTEYGEQRANNNHQEHQTPIPDTRPPTPFENEADTDWSLPANRDWIATILETWQSAEPEYIPLQVGGEYITGNLPGQGVDPSRPGRVPYHYALATCEWVDRAMDIATRALPDWSALAREERRHLLIQCARELGRDRGDLIGCMTLDGAKTVPESDSEVSEAIDFANYYARSLESEQAIADCRMSPLGVVVVTPPWNFPLAIPAGGILAALIAGNTVILKPAPETILVGWHLVQALWRAGIPKEVLQFLPCPDNEVGQSLVTDSRVGAVILTGSRATALLFQEWKPDMRLFAETSGKNSLIITAMSDHDQAIRDLVRSAFGHNGQKCSAASLAICEAEVYDSPTFRRQLRDAVASLPVGSAWDLANRITPLTQRPSANLTRALTTLDAGESWLLEPRMLDGNPHLWSPGIKFGVRPGSFFHQTECFGPVLGLMRADNLADAVALANDTLFGLTGGLHSLDDREQQYWQAHIQVGNAYINRHITGAIVQRQPFGGWKASVVGPGAKAGGPNYVLQFAHWQQVELPRAQAPCSAAVTALLERCMRLLPESDQRQLLHTSAGSYAYAWQTHFGTPHDPSNLRGEANWFRYRPCRGVLLRVADHTDPTAICQVALAACTCSTPLTISLPPTLPPTWSQLADGDQVRVVFEEEPQLIFRLQATKDYDRVRVPGSCSISLRKTALYTNLTLIDLPVLANGRLELRSYLQEQSLSHTYHRYGNIIQLPAGAEYVL